jgi:hypothetical protein
MRPPFLKTLFTLHCSLFSVQDADPYTGTALRTAGLPCLASLSPQI